MPNWLVPFVCLFALATAAFIGGMLMGARTIEQHWQRRLQEAGGCPRCVAFHKLARHARKLIGIRFTIRTTDAKATETAVNEVAKAAEELPPSLNVVPIESAKAWRN